MRKRPNHRARRNPKPQAVKEKTAKLRIDLAVAAVMAAGLTSMTDSNEGDADGFFANLSWSAYDYKK